MSAKEMFTLAGGVISQDEFLEKIYLANLPIVKDNKKTEYYNVPAAFDIEVSSFYQNGEKKATMYIWAFGIYNWVTYGRTWAEYDTLMKKVSILLELNSNRFLRVYVHNLAYEFQFMRKRFTWDKVFLLEDRKPVYAITGGIEYRCSLKLAGGKSLANVGKDLQKYHVEKRLGDLDYHLIRCSDTPITDEELGYCEGDIRVVLAYIQEKIESDGNITLIPLTNTGYVRNYCRKECFKDYKHYRALMGELTLDADEYRQLKRGFAGGFTHASAKYSGKVMKDVGSFDFISSYPSVMLAEKYPMSKSVIIEHIETEEELETHLSKFCCLFDITMHNVRPRVEYDHPISVSKLISFCDVLEDNGRLVEADSITLTCTEQDYWTYKEFYEWDNFEIHTFRIYRKAYLPKNFVKAILNLYKQKTELKGVDGEELNYMISKNMLNAAYGMTVTDIVRDELGYLDDEYTQTKPNMDEAIDKYNKSVKRFLFYPWGVWVTAYARANLFSGIMACGTDYIYADTDSIKILNPENHMDYIREYNEEVQEKLRRAAEFNNIPLSEFTPRNKNGEPKPIGLWDFEGVYDEFKTLGAKRYMTREGDKYTLTVAGLNKRSALDYILVNWNDPMEALADYMTIPREYSGRLTHTYIDNEIEGCVVDYLGNSVYYHELSSIHMEESEYKMTLSSEYRAFINWINNTKEIEE